MTGEMVTISVAELEHLKQRAKKLALDKSYQQLVMQLMQRMSEASGLDNVIDTMLQAIVDVIGGANLILYYKIDETVFYADVYGTKKQLNSLDNERVSFAFQTGEPKEYEHDFSDTQMLTPAFTSAYTWIYPLKVGTTIIGVFQLESLHIAMRELYKQLPVFFNYAALVLKNEILGYRRLQQINKQLQQEIEVRKQTEQALLTAKNDAEAANRAKSIFLANMSHELRTPMNAVLGFSQLLLKNPAITPEQLESLNIINNSGRHLLTLINEVLDMAKIEAGKISLENSNFDLGALICDTLDMMSEHAENKQLNLVLEQSSDFPRFINADESKFRQILINLIGNAIKYTKQGSINISLNSETLEQQKYLLTLTVSDTGLGIASEELPLIFDIFVQVGQESNRQGSGLGLPITKQYVELMGGTIQVESELDKGSIFTVKLPVNTVTESEVIYQVKDKNVVKTLAPHQPSYKILVVEDQLENRLLLKKLLTAVGFEVFEAVDGKKAVEQFIKIQPDFIWMDRRMPIMDGIEATKKIRALPNGKNVKIVALTASVFTQQCQEFLNAGANDIVAKPYREQDIFDSLSKHLGVAFIYEQLSEKQNSHNTPLSIEALQQLPEQVLSGLKDSITSLDVEQSLSIIDHIKTLDSTLAKQLAERVHQFDFATLNKLFATFK